MIDHLDEVLELVEVAERQKLADEREIDELRRALRRIQPPRQPQTFRNPRHDDAPRAPREHHQHREEQPKESPAHHEEPHGHQESEPQHEESGPPPESEGSQHRHID